MRTSTAVGLTLTGLAVAGALLVGASRTPGEHPRSASLGTVVIVIESPTPDPAGDRDPDPGVVKPSHRSASNGRCSGTLAAGHRSAGAAPATGQG